MVFQGAPTNSWQKFGSSVQWISLPMTRTWAVFFLSWGTWTFPVGIHMGPRASGASLHGMKITEWSLSNPLLLEEYWWNIQNLRIYIMHAGYPFKSTNSLDFYWAITSLRRCCLVINWVLPQIDFHNYLRRIVEGPLWRAELCMVRMRLILASVN